MTLAPPPGKDAVVHKTLLDKLWQSHEILQREDGASLLWVDRHLVHEGSHHAFARINARGLPVSRPDLTLAVPDHYAPASRLTQRTATADRMIETLRSNAAANGIPYLGVDDRHHGIVHVVGPELGFTQPGLMIVCGDSHTSTHGAFGALAFGIGATEVSHVLATQTLWQIKPRAMRIAFDGRFAPGVTAKDAALHWISRFGADFGRGFAIEYAGSAITALSMEGRMTLCNLSIEGGARIGLIAPDEVTFEFLKGRALSPSGTDWDRALADWNALSSDAEAHFDREVSIAASGVAPTVTWGTSPEDALPITATVPDPAAAGDRAARIREALEYMGLEPGQPLSGLPVDRVFIGSCTNGRIEDLRFAATVLRGRRAKVPGLVSPGSAAVCRQAEDEGLAAVFVAAGLEWGGSGCSMCVAMNGDLAAPGERCASSTNRNFRGRQGRGVRTHLMSPSMVAAAAIEGCLTDVRPLLAGRTAA